MLTTHLWFDPGVDIDAELLIMDAFMSLHVGGRYLNKPY